MLQEAVDALIDNGRRGRPITGPGSRPLKGSSHMLKKSKVVSAKTCLVNVLTSLDVPLSPLVQHLKCTNVACHVLMAIELFKPFVMREIVVREYAGNVKAAKRMVERGDERIWDILEDVIKEHPRPLTVHLPSTVWKYPGLRTCLD